MTYLNTPVIFNQQPSKVDRVNGIIHDVIVAKVGTAKGHNYKLDDNFISEVVRLGNEHSPGIKARFGHPNICSTALGTYLGRFKNYRLNSPPSGELEGVADLHLDDVAKKSPKGNLHEYVLDMAESNPDMFGASIAFKHGKFRTEFKEIEGKNIEQKFATIESLYATDFVDSPAATDGLFEVFHEDDLAAQVTMFLDDHPQVFKLLDNKPEILNEFLEKYKTHKSMNFKDEIDKLKNWVADNFSSKSHNDLPLSGGSRGAELEQLQSNFQKQITNLEKKFGSDEKQNLQEQLNQANESVTDLETRNTDLESQLNQLKASPTSTSVSGDPQLNINPKDKDETGKILLSELPTHLRKKLKTTTNE